jgi:2-polyprenyl-6-methoxyphenol hydroxylase-like FAD-dependent oxidoreductase
MSDHHEAGVLVVGAGPVGLVAACELLQQGIAVRVIDRAPGTGGHSRAIAVWPRSLELLSRVGVGDELAQAGNRLDAVRYFSRRRPIGAIRLDRIDATPYPFGLIVPQARTEAALRARLAELGGQVEHGTELVGLDLSGPRPRAALRRAGAAAESVTASWLIGADGAHSTVRSLAGIPFRPEGPEVLFAIADGIVEGDLDERTLVYSYTSQGALGLAPFGGGRFRVAVGVPAWESAEPPGAGLFRDALAARAPVPAALHSMQWSTIFAARRRTAATFRSGRCFLAGDAAHIFSAAGGQGMNTGIQDAVNLAWKLGGVLRDRLDPAILDSYDPERRPAAARTSAFTAQQTRWGQLSGGLPVLARDLAVRGAAAAGALQRAGAPLTAQHDVRYGAPRGWPEAAAAAAGWTRGARPGDRFPVFARPPGGGPGAPPQPWPTAPPDSFTVLLRTRGPRGAAWASACAEVRAALPGWVQVVDISAWHSLRAAAGRGRGALVIRPDGHVGSGWLPAEPAAVARALALACVREPAARPASRREEAVAI